MYIYIYIYILIIHKMIVELLESNTLSVVHIK